MAVVDRGYRGCKSPVSCEVLLPGPPLKRDTAKERNKKRVLCRQRAAIEPIIGHLKHDYRLSGNWLKGSSGGFDQFVAVGLRLEFEEVDDRFVFVSGFRRCCLPGVDHGRARYMYGTDSVKRQ